MPIFTSHPIQTIRIEPLPEVGAFYDRAQAWTERAALALIALTVLYFAAQFLRLALQGQH